MHLPGPSALDIGKYVVAHAPLQDGEFDEARLQALCYYAQGWHLALLGGRLTPEQFFRHEEGCFASSLHIELRLRGAGYLRRGVDTDVAVFRDVTDALLRKVYGAYRQFTSTELVEMVRGEPPWREALARGDVEISVDTMRRFFREEMPRRGGPTPPRLPDPAEVRRTYESDGVQGVLAEARAEVDAARYWTFD